MNLKGKTFLLTGTRRIGKDVARSLGEQGANLAIAYLSSKADAEFICAECSAIGAKTDAFQADLSKENDINNFAEEALKSFGQIDGLVHMASPYPVTPLGKISMETLSQTMETIAGSSLLLGQKVANLMQQNSSEIKGKMIFFSDWSVLRKPAENYIVYNAAKAAVNSITMTLAKNLAPAITVNAIAPGPILKPENLTEEENKEVIAQTPMAKWGGSEEISKAVLYLLDSDFITGQILTVDGGRSIS